MSSFNKKYPKTAKVIRYTGNALKVAHSAYNMAKIVASIVNSERKYYDMNSFVNQQPNNTGTIIHLTGIPQGNTEYTRDGNSVAVKSLQCRIKLQNITTQGNHTVRLIFFRDNNDNNGTPPAVADLLEPALAATGNATLAMLNRYNSKRFKVIRDIETTFGQFDSQSSNRYIELFKQFKMMKDAKGNPTRARHITFKGAAGVDTESGHLYCLVLSDAAASANLVMSMSSRVRFYDN